MNLEKIKNTKIFKVWDIFIILLVVIAIFLLICSYGFSYPTDKVNILFFSLSYDMSELLSMVITYIFVFDLVLRIVLFKKKYLFSTDILIDILACLDVFSPALKAVRGIKATRMARVARVLRILRVMRGLKAVKFLSKNEIEMKLFNPISIFIILIFVFLSAFISFTSKNKLEVQFKNLVDTALTSSIDDNNKLNEDIFIDKLKDNTGMSQLFSYDFKLGAIEYKKDFLNKKDYFEDDIITIELGSPEKDYSIKFAARGLRHNINEIELYTILTSFPMLLIMLFIINYTLQKHYDKPLQKFKDIINRYKEFAVFDNVNTESNDVLEKLKMVYNDMILHYKALLGSELDNAEDGSSEPGSLKVDVGKMLEVIDGYQDYKKFEQAEIDNESNEQLKKIKESYNTAVDYYSNTVWYYYNQLQEKKE